MKINDAPRRTDASTLNDVMGFDRVIRVHRDGSISKPNDIYPPDLIDGELIQYPVVTADNGYELIRFPNQTGWHLMSGYSGQDRYAGPIMHPSEFISGRLAEDILARPGLYVALVSYITPESGYDDDSDSDDDVDGWAVAYCDADDTDA